MSRVLIVEDERILARNVEEKLVAHRHEVRVAHSGKDALIEASRFLPDVILLDVRLPDADGIQLLPRLRAEATSANVVVVTAHGNERIAVQAMKNGACEYLTKPVDLDELQLLVERIVDQQQVSDNLMFLRHHEEQASGLDRIVGESAAVQSLKEAIRRLTRGDILALRNPPTVLITGETGTGKDLAARAIHYHGPRRKRPFIQVNCTALPATLFESELFGHLRGAFTSASAAKRGLFEVAHGGTIFLDEIGHLEPDLQAKLLHAIEHHEIRPVGATETKPVDVHIIAATNRDLSAAVNAGEFRRDLYHRLCVLSIYMPPLRERADDIPLLAEHFLTLHCRRFGQKVKSFSADAIDVLRRATWRGNIRELSHLVERCILQADGEIIQAGELPPVSDGQSGDVNVQILGGRTIAIDFEKGRPTLDEVEHAILVAAFEYTGQNLSRAAKTLGITREAMRYRLNRSTEPTSHGS